MAAVGGSEESAGCEPSTVADDVLEARIPAVRVWGPVPAAQAHEVGAWTAAASILLKPTPEHVPMDLLHHLRLLIGAAVLPRKTDTAQTLQAHLSDDKFLHPAAGCLQRVTARAVATSISTQQGMRSLAGCFGNTEILE